MFLVFGKEQALRGCYVLDFYGGDFATFGVSVVEYDSAAGGGLACGVVNVPKVDA